MIRVSDIHLTFNHNTPIENKVLRGLSLDIKAGEFVTIIGSNGAGKSSLLNTISGDYIPDQGKIIIDNTDVTKLPTWKRASFVARVFQDPMVGTCSSLSIEENLALAYHRGLKQRFVPALNQELRFLFKEKLATLNLGLENRLTDVMGLLSGGQRQAISLLMSSLQNSKVLLLDEHTAALDPKTAHFVLKLTDEIVNRNKLTTIMITHSMKQALEHGTRTVMLHEGNVILDVKGKERADMEVKDLLNLFEAQKGEELGDDALLLS